MRSRLTTFLVLVLLGLFFLTLFYYPPIPDDPGTYNATTLRIADANGTQLATVDVRIADTREKRLVGLSQTDTLEPGDGMLFIHSSEDTYSYVMRNMSFSLDIVFVASDGTITEIHHAERTADETFEGRGQYVLEVPYGWTNETGIEVGDQVLIPDGIG